MKHMTFQSSCSYCCIANLLEAGGVEIQDRELAVRLERALELWAKAIRRHFGVDKRGEF